MENQPFERPLGYGECNAAIDLARAFVFACIFLMGGSQAQAQIVSVGQGSYTTTLPVGEKAPSNQSGEPVTPLKTASFSGPVPTNDWWTSIAWNYRGNAYSGHFYAHPLAFQAQADGLNIRYPTRVSIAPHFYIHDLANDLLISLAGLAAPDTRVEAASDFAVTASWDDGTNSLLATIGHGLPFVYFTKSGGDVTVAFNDTPNIWSNSDGVVGATINGHHYGIFGPGGSTWTGAAPLQSDLNGQDYFSVAVLPDDTPETLEFYRQHAYAFVTDTEVSWRYDESTARLTTTFTAITELKEEGNGHLDQTLMALYRHQWLHSAAPLTDYTYVSPRGAMKVLDGNRFGTVQTFGGVLPALPQDCNATADPTLYNFVDEVYNTENLFSGNLGQGDTYWTGKGLGRLAALVPLADQVAHTQARDRFLNEIKSRLEDWLTATDGSPLFYYDDTWSTLIGFPDAFGSATDLNDHHFHYGYHIMAAATVAQYDPEWASESNWGGMVELLIKDVANWDRTDTMFPFLRNFDPYAGHSWASGHSAFADGNNQESSSEAMNFATGLIRWGAETGNTTIRDLGIFIYSTERSAIEQYWFDVDNTVFPEGYAHTTVGLIWSNKAAYETFFGNDPEFIHGINFLPLTGGSLYLGRHPDYVLANYNDMFINNGGEPEIWPDLMWEYLALADPATAVSKFNSNTDYTPEAGETKAHTYHWINHLNVLGRVDTTVTANIPTYAVFNKEGTRSYAAYNPTGRGITVQFSDGFSLSVPADTLVTHCFEPTSTVDDIVEPPTAYALSAVYPNPFNRRARLALTVRRPQHVRVAVYDILGRQIALIYNGMLGMNQPYTFEIDGSDLPSGVYLYEVVGEYFQAGGTITHVKNM